MIGSPHWTRFELLRANWPCGRTCQRPMFQNDRRGSPPPVHSRHPPWTRLELAEGARATSGSRVTQAQFSQAIHAGMVPGGG